WGIIPVERRWLFEWCGPKSNALGTIKYHSHSGCSRHDEASRALPGWWTQFIIAPFRGPDEISLVQRADQRARFLSYSFTPPAADCRRKAAFHPAAGLHCELRPDRA